MANVCYTYKKVQTLVAGQIAKYEAIPAKDKIHLKSQLVTRYPTTNRNPKEGNKTVKVLRPATNRFPTKVRM
jgi:hypothetical protein